MAGRQLSYTVSPDAVPCSASATQLSVVTLSVTAANGTGAPVSVSAIDVSIPGSGWNTRGDLVADPSSITAAPGDATP